MGILNDGNIPTPEFENVLIMLTGLVIVLDKILKILVNM